MDRRITRALGWLRNLLRDPEQEPDLRGDCLQPPVEIDPRTLEQGLRQVEMLRQSGRRLEGCTLVDIGTCWQPTIPLLFFLAGCDDIVLVDRKRVLDGDLLVRTARNLRTHAAVIAARLELDERRVRDLLRLDDDTTFFGALRQFKMQYLAPCNLLEMNLPADSVDLVTCRSLLDRYSESYVKSLLPEVARFLRPDGLMCHCIDQTERLHYVKLLKDARYTVEIEEFNPVLRVVTESGPALDEDPTLLNSFLVAVPPRRREDTARS